VRSRGYNQAALLAKEVGRRLDILVEETHLPCYRWSGPQVEIDDYDSRWASVAYAFQFDADVQGKSLNLTVYDMTMGPTMHSVPSTLKEAVVAHA
jgi:predicted amidophosphoribosyltransferase